MNQLHYDQQLTAKRKLQGENAEKYVVNTRNNQGQNLFVWFEVLQKPGWYLRTNNLRIELPVHAAATYLTTQEV